MKLLGLIFLLSCLPNALIDFAFAQWKTDSQIQMDDAYKWIYQATRGGEHAVPDRQMAGDWLNAEWQTLSAPKTGEPLWQPLCEDGEIGRLNLRPFRASGGKMNDLLDAFFTSSQNFNNSESNFVAAWKELGKRLKKKSQNNLKWKNWKILDRRMRLKGYPAIHHSQIYEQKYQPAYRILTSDIARRFITKLE